MQTRRNFIQKGGLILFSTAAGVGFSEHASASFLSKKPAMIIDLNRCTGCQSCVIACKSHAKTAPKKFNTRLISVETGGIPAQIIFTPVQCNQCGNPPCVSACPYDATFKLANGVVVIDWEKCKSCGNCIGACPYKARFHDALFDDRADKCDFCNDRLEHGLDPVCVEACAPGARIMGDMINPQDEFAAYQQSKVLKIRKPEQKTSPRIFYVQAGQGREDLI